MLRTLANEDTNPRPPKVPTVAPIRGVDYISICESSKSSLCGEGNTASHEGSQAVNFIMMDKLIAVE